MFALQLTCPAQEAEDVSARLWDWGTLAISEQDWGGEVQLLAGFVSDSHKDALLAEFAAFDPGWEEDNRDWEAETREAWPPRSIGQRLFLAAAWRQEPTPAGRVRLVHNPGSASGTGEHPCTQMMLEALERVAPRAGCVVDVGTGSGILAIAARLLGASRIVALDTDEGSLQTARENGELNGMRLPLLAGSADCLRDGAADVMVANINGTVLLSLMDDLQRVTRRGGTLLISGFGEGEAAVFQQMFADSQVAVRNEWRCLTIQLP